jgi:hypothetical protein
MLSRHGLSFDKEMKAAIEALRLQRDGSQLAVDSIRLRLFDIDRLRRQRPWADAKPEYPAVSGGGGGGSGGGGESEWEQQTTSLYAFLMGTHERCIGYASRDEPCAVRLVAHSTDLLRLICAFVRGTTTGMRRRSRATRSLSAGARAGV